VLARAVALVASLPVPDADRAAVLERVVESLKSSAAEPPATGRMPDVRVLNADRVAQNPTVKTSGAYPTAPSLALMGSPEKNASGGR
jgi:hypothetical protein